MGAARTYQKLGQTAQSKNLYDEVVDPTPTRRIRRLSRSSSCQTQGLFRGLSFEPVRETVAGAKISLAGGPVDPMAFAELQAFFKGRRVSIGFPPNGIIDDKFIRRVSPMPAQRKVCL